MRRYFYFCKSCFHYKETDTIHPLERMKCSRCGSKSIGLVGSHGELAEEAAKAVEEKLATEYETVQMPFPKEDVGDQWHCG